MPITPMDLLSQAKSLLARAEQLPDIPEREALLRTVTSRTYYVVYHGALARARREGFTGAPRGYASHEGLWNWWFVDEQPDLFLGCVFK